MDELESNAIDESENVTIRSDLTDYGPMPAIIDMTGVTIKNKNFRTTLWTGDFLQLTLMSLKPGEDIGVEKHDDLDQFIKIIDGYAAVRMGSSDKALDLQSPVTADNSIIIPAGTYHNIINTGYQPLKLYSIYAPPAHPYNTVHVTKADAMAAENHMENDTSR